MDKIEEQENWSESEDSIDEQDYDSDFIVSDDAELEYKTDTSESDEEDDLKQYWTCAKCSHQYSIKPSSKQKE